MESRSGLGFVFPGQGSQYVGMGKELFERYKVAKQVFLQANDVLGMRIDKLCFDGPEQELVRTSNTQPALLTVSIACHQVIETTTGVVPQAVAGHSVGEFSALVAASAMSFEDALRIVRRRGELMEQAVPLGRGGMMVVLGLDDESVNALVEGNEWPGVLEVANYNCPGQVVVTGETPALEAFVKAAGDAGARRVLKLAVSGPFHSSLMKPVSCELEQLLNEIDVNPPRTEVVSNVTAGVMRLPTEIKSLVAAQASQPVKWSACVKGMIDRGIVDFVEIGPGEVLSGLIKRIDKRAVLRSTGTGEALEKSLAHLKGVVVR